MQRLAVTIDVVVIVTEEFRADFLLKSLVIADSTAKASFSSPYKAEYATKYCLASIARQEEWIV